MNTLLIFIGAGLGGVSRYGVSNGIYALLGRYFPYGTLFVNVSGCFLMGLMAALVVERLHDFEPQLRSLMLIGFLGGYTTFSSFSIETIGLLEHGAWLGALLNIVLSITLCIAATGLGLFVGRYL